METARAAILVDAHDPVTIGGTGRPIDWAAARAIAATRPLVLAGGLRPRTSGEAVAPVAPWGVDVASGVEQAPGVKDPARVRAFVQAVRAADAARAQTTGSERYDDGIRRMTAVGHPGVRAPRPGRPRLLR